MEPLHILVCSALGVGHYTPTSNFVRLLCEQHGNEVYVTFFAPLRGGEGDKTPDLPSYTNLQVEKYELHDATPVIMIDMRTKADELSTEVFALLSKAYQKGWPEVSVVIHDSFAWYAHEIVLNSKGKLIEYLFNPSSSIPNELLCNDAVMESVLEGKTHYTFDSGETIRASLICELFHGPKEPLLDHQDKDSIFDHGEATVSADIAGLNEDFRTSLSNSNRKIYPMSPLCIWQETKADGQDDVFEWLDAQPDRSVIYIALGSLYSMHREGIYNLATALERLDRLHFLWAIDESKISQDGPQVSESCKKNLADRGKIVPWVNQPRVLAHRALRGFVSHCGWNSLVENATFGGLPVVCLPLGSEQHINSLIVEDVWRSGVCPLERTGLPAKSGPPPVLDPKTPVIERVLTMLPYMSRWQWPDVDGFCASLTRVFYTDYDKFALNAARVQASCLKGVTPDGAVFRNLRNFLADVRARSQAPDS